MAILTTAGSSAWSPLPDPKASTGKRIDPRSLVGFAKLLTIGIAAMDLFLCALMPAPALWLDIAILGGLTIAACWAGAAVVAWFVLLSRCLLILCERAGWSLCGRPTGIKPPTPDGPTGVTDEWLDGPS